jgi:hypothetical protein
VTSLIIKASGEGFNKKTPRTTEKKNGGPHFDESPVNSLEKTLPDTGWKMTGWWLSHPSEKYEFVNGKDYPIYYGQ